MPSSNRITQWEVKRDTDVSIRYNKNVIYNEWFIILQTTVITLYSKVPVENKLINADSIALK